MSLPFPPFRAILSLAFLSIAVACTAEPVSNTSTEPSKTAQRSPISVSVQGAGTPVVLIPGLSSSRDVWQETAAHLNKDHRVYLVQVKGFAGSLAATDSAAPGLMDRLETALAAYIQNEKLASPTIIGHSMGGYLALRLQRDHPDLVGKTIIVDALPFYSLIMNPAATEQNMVPMASGFKAQLIAGAAQEREVRKPQQKQMLARLVRGEENLDMITEWALDSDAKLVGEAVFELMTSDLRSDLKTLKTRTLVLAAWQEGGPYTQAQTAYFWKGQYAAHTGASVEVIPGSRHFIMLDQPALFLHQVDTFLASD
jgi:pimeloyl-ACP methyl ester carboxylesterase